MLKKQEHVPWLYPDNLFKTGSHAVGNSGGRTTLNQLITPDGRYIVVRSRLWRTSNPDLTHDRREQLVTELMRARREVKEALRKNDPDQLALARHAVHAAKVGLGERGPVWWTDGVSDYNRYLVKNTPYSVWYQKLEVS